MSFLRRGVRRRGKGAAALTTIVALGAFQALAIVGAGVASAVTGCTYNPATDTINITIDPGDDAFVAVETAAADLDPAAPAGAILFSVDGATWLACGSATNSNTVTISVLGSPGTNEAFHIDNFVGGEFNTAIAWAIDLGTGIDVFRIAGSDDTDDEVVLTDDSFTVNGGGGELNGVELMIVEGNDGDDTIDATGLVNSILISGVGGPGSDWIAPGPQSPFPPAITFEVLDGGAGDDTLSYATRTASVTIDAVNGWAGRDANGDCDVTDFGDELDIFIVGTFEVLESGSGNDCFLGNAGVVETFVPGDGDDDITGQAGDTIDWSSSSAAVTIDPANGEATGQGTDTFAGPTSFVGSPFDDVLIWDGTTTGFSGGDGVDHVDASADTSAGVVIDLDVLDGTADDLENATGGTGDDDLFGNRNDNRLDGNAGNDDLEGRGGQDNLYGRDGDDSLDGGTGNDYLEGGAGEDEYFGDTGADTVSYKNAPAGVTVDISLGFASGGDGDDSFNDFVEIVLGSNFADDITGGQFGFGGSVNFRVKGRGGNDNITGSTSNDTLIGGKGRDSLRGGSGDDTLSGNAGNDSLWGGNGTDIGKGGKGKDTCRQVEVERSCER